MESQVEMLWHEKQVLMFAASRTSCDISCLRETQASPTTMNLSISKEDQRPTAGSKTGIMAARA